MPHADDFLKQTAEIATKIDCEAIEAIAHGLAELRQRKGRLFVIGVGGSAANAGHAVNDFRKLCGIEAYAPTDNVAELTARTNDDGWETVFAAWLATSNAKKGDAVFILSVGGGDTKRGVSVNIVRALDEAKRRGLEVYGVVGRDGGYTKCVGDVVVLIPQVDAERVTPHTEGFQAIIWHCLVSHPALALGAARWESLEATP